MAKQLGSPKAIMRMTSYVRQARPRSEEMLIDEKTTDVMDVIMAKQKETKIKDVKILEISTEEVIKKIYEGGTK